MDNVRLGIIGLGNMGSVHAAQVRAGKIPRCELAAVCDVDDARLRNYGPELRYTDPQALFASGSVDAVLIATPHFSHVPLGVTAPGAGLHVLVEKPIAVHKADAPGLMAAAEAAPALVFGAMFNQRTDPCYRRLRAMLQSGELGPVRRVQWTVTDLHLRANERDLPTGRDRHVLDPIRRRPGRVVPKARRPPAALAHEGLPLHHQQPTHIW